MREEEQGTSAAPAAPQADRVEGDQIGTQQNVKVDGDAPNLVPPSAVPPGQMIQDPASAPPTPEPQPSGDEGEGDR